MTVDLLFTLGVSALTFIIGWRGGRAFANAAHHQGHLVQAFVRDEAVMDAADMAIEPELPYRPAGGDR